jgi:peptidyl-prolyl cis-trans isomerase SurA
MTTIGWLGVPLIGMAGFSNIAMAAPAHRGPAQTPAAQSQGNQNGDIRIAAVVNDEIISVADLRSRVKMVMLSSNFPDSPEIQQRIAAQVLRTIVDEKLQMQEAKKQNVTATEEEIKKGISQIEQQNNMQSGQLDAVLKAHGIDRGALVDQITASIVWAKLVSRLVAQSNVISDDEIDNASNRIKENANEPQSRDAEIFLAVDNPQQD